MKKSIIIFLSLLIALSSCGSDKRRAKRYYRQAQEVASSDPDSALILIDSVLNIMVFLEDDTRFNMSLMQAEAIFKHPDGERRELSRRIKVKKIYTMSELERSPEYFAKKGEYIKASYGALYSGYALRELRDNDNAMVCFKNAVIYAELANDSLAYARASYNLARLLHLSYNSDQAIEVLSKAEKAFGNNYEERAMALNMMAVINIISGRFEDAENCLEQSLAFATKSKSAYAYWKIINNYSVCFREQGKTEEAVAFLRKIDNPSDTSDMVLLYLNYGKTLAKGLQYDSAAYYFNKVKELLPISKIKAETVVSAYEALSAFEELNNNFPSALSYKKMSENQQIEIIESLRKDNIYEINKKYDYEAMKNAMNRKIISNYRFEMMMAIVIIIVFATCLILLYQIIHKNRKEAEMSATLLRVMKDNERLIQDKSDSLSKKLKSMQRLEILTKDHKDKSLLRNLEKEIFGDKDHWEAMNDLFNAIYPGLYDSLIEKYPDMGELERRVYMLNDFKLSRIDEAMLLGVSTSVIDKA
ncbi:MAG: hypothetical protein ACI358_05060, partial [Candidatus Limimorpha sp.]